MQYLGFGVVRKNRETPDTLTIENSYNGLRWDVPLASVPVLSACRTSGHVVDVYRNEDGSLRVEWPNRP